MYSFLRNDPMSLKSVLVVANLHPSRTFSDIRCLFSNDAIQTLNLPAGSVLTGTDLLTPGSGIAFHSEADSLISTGLPLPDLPPLTVRYFELAHQK